MVLHKVHQYNSVTLNPLHTGEWKCTGNPKFLRWPPRSTQVILRAATLSTPCEESLWSARESQWWNEDIDLEAEVCKVNRTGSGGVTCRAAQQAYQGHEWIPIPLDGPSAEAPPGGYKASGLLALIFVSFFARFWPAPREAHEEPVYNRSGFA